MNKARPGSSPASSTAASAAAANKKKKVEDYDFGDVLGEGAFGAVSDGFFGFFRFARHRPAVQHGQRSRQLHDG